MEGRADATATKERRVLSLWTTGGAATTFLALDVQFAELARSGEPVELVVNNVFRRLCVFQAVYYWGFEVRTLDGARHRWFDDEWVIRWRRPDIKTTPTIDVHMYVSRPDGWQPPRCTMTQLRRESGHLLLDGSEQPVLPLAPNAQTALSRHEVPRVVLAYIFGQLGDISSVGCALRVCKTWAQVGHTDTLWRVLCETLMLESSEQRALAWWTAQEAARVEQGAERVPYRERLCEWFTAKRAACAGNCSEHYGSQPQLWTHRHGVRAPPGARLRDVAKERKRK